MLYYLTDLLQGSISQHLMFESTFLTLTFSLTNTGTDAHNHFIATHDSAVHTVEVTGKRFWLQFALLVTHWGAGRWTIPSDSVGQREREMYNSEEIMNHCMKHWLYTSDKIDCLSLQSLPASFASLRCGLTLCVTKSLLSGNIINNRFGYLEPHSSPFLWRGVSDLKQGFISNGQWASAVLQTWLSVIKLWGFISQMDRDYMCGQRCWLYLSIYDLQLFHNSYILPVHIFFFLIYFYTLLYPLERASITW